jgi:hypothetical protein
MHRVNITVALQARYGLLLQDEQDRHLVWRHISKSRRRHGRGPDFRGNRFGPDARMSACGRLAAVRLSNTLRFKALPMCGVAPPSCMDDTARGRSSP